MPSISASQIIQAAIDYKTQLVQFCQKLIQTPSMPGEESECAKLVAEKMKALGYDEVWVDKAGNVIGLVKGEDPKAPVIALNSHLDHVDPGDPKDWKYHPYSGEIVGDKIYGRAASDIKGALAVQIFAPAVLLKCGLRPLGDVYLTAVVMEEVGGTGTHYLFEKDNFKCDLVISGEATSNGIYLGHRGQAVVYLTFHGRSGHASAPERAINPNYQAAKFLLELEKELPNLSKHPILGQSSISPTIYDTGIVSTNVIPEKVRLVLDWRTSTENREDVIKFLKKLTSKIQIPVNIELGKFKNVTYTGYEAEEQEKIFGGFVTPEDHPLVQKSIQAVERALGQKPQVKLWRFATDGRISAAKGITTIGFSPCEEHLTHTTDDHVKISMMLDSLKAYPLILGNREQKLRS